MADQMKLYKVEIGGLDHILQLTAEDAKRYGKNARPFTGKAPAPGADSDSSQNPPAPAPER